MFYINNENDCTTEEMVEAIQRGETQYFEPLFNRFLPLVRKMNSLYALRLIEKEDFHQEARIVLYRAINYYEAGKGLKFPGYYKLMLQHRIYSLIRKEGADKRKGDCSAVSYEVLEEKNASVMRGMYVSNLNDGATPESIIRVRESAGGYLDTLSKLEKEVFYHFMNGEEFPAIAEKLGCEVTRVKQAYDRCRLKMKKILLE